MPTAGVVSGQPAEGIESRLELARPALPTFEGLSFEGCVEGLGGGIVGTGPNRAHALPDPG